MKKPKNESQRRKQQQRDLTNGVLLRKVLPSGTSPVMEVEQVLNLPFLQRLHIFYLCTGALKLLGFGIYTVSHQENFPP